MAEILPILREGAILVFCILACVFALAGTAGLFRFPDTYTRLQASSLAGSSAPFSVFLAACFAAPDLYALARILLIIIFFFVSSPTATHIIGRYAWNSGLDPWIPPVSGRRRHSGKPR